VKESADGAQQSAKACEDLSSLALDMQKLVGNFRVEDNGRGSQGIGGSGRPSSSRQTSLKKKAYAAGAR